MTEYIYHGSKIAGLKQLVPRDPGRGESYVYATSHPFFAAVLLHRPGAGLVRIWGRNEDNGKLYLVERKENTLERIYSGQEGYIYALRRAGFERPPRRFKEEWVNTVPVDVLEEIHIKDLWQYFLDLQAADELEIYFYKDRQKHATGSDEAIIATALHRIEKYGEKIIDEIREYQPRLLDEILSRRDKCI